MFPLAHVGGPVFEPLQIAGLTLAAVAYTVRSQTLAREGRSVPIWRIVCFASGLFLIAVAFVSPLGRIDDELVFAHMGQHLLMGDLGALLIVLGLTGPLLQPLLASRWLGWLRHLAHPLVALPLWLATYYAWHLPAAYDTALRHPSTLLHFEHLCYFVTGVLVWWPVLTGRLDAGSSAAYLFAAFALASPLGLLLALIPRAVYDFYVHAPRIWGWSALTDQQVAGLTMAAEEAIVFFGAFAFYFVRFMRRESTALDLKHARWTR